MPIHVALLGAAFLRKMSLTIVRGVDQVLEQAELWEQAAKRALDQASTEEMAHYIIVRGISSSRCNSRPF